MAVPIVMPKLGMVMSEGTIARWSKSAGDAVTEGEIIAEIETEKLNYDLEATGVGIFHPLASEGDAVAVDGVIGYLLADGEKRAGGAGAAGRQPRRSTSNAQRAARTATARGR